MNNKNCAGAAIVIAFSISICSSGAMLLWYSFREQFGSMLFITATLIVALMLGLQNTEREEK